ncbi:MAG: hypothetical protein NUV61_03950 [Candidatus Azambacteria bacterium]|nr:hypothetical protein [Candidatus Azambacteria bacterium]
MAMESLSFEKFELSEKGWEFKKKYRAILEKDPAGVSDRIAEFVRGTLWNGHSPAELHNYEAYCIIVSSTPIAQPEHFDLEDESSIDGKGLIEQFIESLEEETK